MIGESMKKANGVYIQEFFEKRSSKGWRGGGRDRSTQGISQLEFFHLLKMASSNKEVYEDVLKFVNGHSRVAKDMTMEDLNLLFLSETHESI